VEGRRSRSEGGVRRVVTLGPPPLTLQRALVLASASPRRQDLLSLLDLPFEILSADVDEGLHDALPPAERARRLAEDKAVAVSRLRPDALILGADTLVVLATEVMGKPRDADDARRMLRLLSGRTHQVITGLALVAEGQILCGEAVTTDVRFRKLGEAEISSYVATGEPMDKAGAYAIQGRGAILIEGIAGDYANVVGLPLTRLALLLRYHHGTVLGLP
jgi:nucleoside triphosphate pyrophosphatase